MMGYNGIVYNVSRFPLLNTNPPKDPHFSNCSNLPKFAQLMKSVLNGDGTYSKFKTNDNIQWLISDSQIKGLGSKTGNVTAYTPVTIDLNGDKGPNKIYGENGYSKKPDRYKFYVTATGDIIPADKYGQMYIDTRRSLKKIKNELSKLNDSKYKDLVNPSNESKIPGAVFDVAYIALDFDASAAPDQFRSDITPGPVNPKPKREPKPGIQDDDLNPPTPEPPAPPEPNVPEDEPDTPEPDIPENLDDLDCSIIEALVNVRLASDSQLEGVMYLLDYAINRGCIMEAVSAAAILCLEDFFSNFLNKLN